MVMIRTFVHYYYRFISSSVTVRRNIAFRLFFVTIGEGHLRVSYTALKNKPTTLPRCRICLESFSESTRFKSHMVAIKRLYSFCEVLYPIFKTIKTYLAQVMRFRLMLEIY